MPSRSRRKRSRAAARRRPPLMRWLAVATILVVGLLYYRPLKSYLDTKASLEERAPRCGRCAPSARARAPGRRVRDARGAGPRARRLGLVKPGERLFIVKGIEEWRARRNPRTRIGGGG